MAVSWQGGIASACSVVRWAAALPVVLISLHPASAQTSRLTMQGSAENADSAPIRDGLGRVCLNVEAAARAQIINPEMIDHIVSIKNNCAKSIKLWICYFKSERCSQVNLQAYKRVDTMLGSMRGVHFFRYTIKQK